MTTLVNSNSLTVTDLTGKYGPPGMKKRKKKRRLKRKMP
jgi:hypothetical protein